MILSDSCHHAGVVDIRQNSEGMGGGEGFECLSVRHAEVEAIIDDYHPHRHHYHSPTTHANSEV